MSPGSKRRGFEALRWYEKRNRLFEELRARASDILTRSLLEGGISQPTITSRLKNQDSFLKKIKKKRYLSALEMTDVVGLRVILPLRSEVNRAKAIIRSVFDIDETRSVDKSAQLGTNRVGYRSIHIIARLGDSRTDLPEYRQLTDYFEIQVRTLIEHAWAQIEHDLGYKPSSTLTDGQKRGLALVAGMLELADGKLDELASSIRDLRHDVKEEDERTVDGQASSTAQPSMELADQPLTVAFADALLGEALGRPYKKRSSRFLKPHGIVRELDTFGVRTVGDLIGIFPEDLHAFVESENANRSTFIGTLRDMMMIHNTERYFGVAWAKEWDDLGDQEILRLGSFGADMDVLRHHLRPVGRDKVRIQELVDWFTDNYEDATDIVPYDDSSDTFEYDYGGPYEPLEELDTMFGDRSERMNSIIDKATERILNISTEWVKPGEYS